MTSWYYAICDEHRCLHVVQIVFNDTLSTLMEKEDYKRSTAAWLARHEACKLRLAGRDEHLPGDDYELEEP